MLWVFAIALLSTFLPLLVHSEHVQLQGNETVVTYWPGDTDMTNHDLCSVAITKTTVVRIQGFGTGSRKQFLQDLPANTLAAGILYNKPTTSLWLGVADTSGTITWMFADYEECEDDFHTEWDYPVMHYPGVTWDRAFTQIDMDNYQKTIVTFVGDTLLVQFGFDEVGQPSVKKEYALPWNFGTAQREVVGFGEGLPWGSSSTPSLVVARQITDGTESTGELILLDQANQKTYQLRYFPNLRGWQSHYTASSVSGFALVDPFSPEANVIVDPSTGKVSSSSPSLDSSTGWLVGFVPGADQPLSIPFDLPPTRRWSSGVSWTRVDEVRAIGVVLVGSVEPGGPLDLHFVLLANNSFTLLPTKVTVNETNVLQSWIPIALSFMSAPERDNEPKPAIYFAAQNLKGPIIFSIPFPPISNLVAEGEALLLKPAEEIITKDLLSSAIFEKVDHHKKSVLCNVNSKCVLLSPKDACQAQCCQTYLSAKDHKFLSCCCKDCNLGNCVGDPGSCIH